MKYTVTTYEDLEKCVKVFASGTFNVFFLIGSPGQSKSTIVRKVLKKARFIRGGSVTPFQLFRELWYHQDQDFIIDDVEQFYRDKGLVQLLKAVCETEKVKTVQWMTATNQLESEGVEKEFTTSSRFVIILNEWDNVNQNVLSLEDRGLMVNFRPPVEEVLRVGKKFVKDREVIRFVEDNRPFISCLSLRALVTASEMKAAGLPWREPLIESLGIGLMTLIKELAEDPTLLREEDRVRAWTDRTGVNGRPGLGRTAYFTHKRRFEELKLHYAGSAPRAKPGRLKAS